MNGDENRDLSIWSSYELRLHPHWSASIDGNSDSFYWDIDSVA